MNLNHLDGFSFLKKTTKSKNISLQISFNPSILNKLYKRLDGLREKDSQRGPDPFTGRLQPNGWRFLGNGFWRISCCQLFAEGHANYNRRDCSVPILWICAKAPIELGAMSSHPCFDTRHLVHSYCSTSPRGELISTIFWLKKEDFVLQNLSEATLC